MNRRSCLKSLIGVAAVALSPWPALAKLINPVPLEDLIVWPWVNVGEMILQNREWINAPYELSFGEPWSYQPIHSLYPPRFRTLGDGLDFLKEYSYLPDPELKLTISERKP